MTIQNIFAIDDVRHCSVTQSKKRDKHHDKQEKENLHAAENPTRFSAKRVNPLGPSLDNNQGMKSSKIPRCRRNALPPNLPIVSPKNLAMKI